MGASTTACTPPFAASTFSTIGIPNAAVLPVPVRDWTTRSLPASALGIASSWTGVGDSYPLASRLPSVAGERERALKLRFTATFSM